MIRTSVFLPFSLLLLGLSSTAHALPGSCSALGAALPPWVPSHSCNPSGTYVCQLVAGNLDCGLGRLPGGPGEIYAVDDPGSGIVFAFGASTTSLGVTTEFCCYEYTGAVGNVSIVGTGADDHLAFTYVDGAGTRHDMSGGRTGTALGQDGFDVIEGSYDLAAGYVDDLRGGGKDDDIYGNDGNDTISGGIGFDRLSGGNGDDQLVGGDHADILHGGAGDDVLQGDNGDDELCTGTAGGLGDQVNGGGMDDVLASGGGFVFGTMDIGWDTIPTAVTTVAGWDVKVDLACTWTP